MTNSLYNIPSKQAVGSSTSLGDHVGNVASECGFSAQYGGLQALNRAYCDRGLAVRGFPSIDFAEQELGTNASIQVFSRLTHGVEFPVMRRISVKGKDTHSIYEMLTFEQPETMFEPGSDLVPSLAERAFAGEGEVTWNFEKFLIDRGGAVVRRIASDSALEDEILVEPIKARLAA